MTIERNMFVRLAAKIVGKKSIYKVHDYLLNRRFEKLSYQIRTDAKANNEVLQALSSDGVFCTNLQKLSFSDEEIAGLFTEYQDWANKLDGFSSSSKKFYEHKMNANRLTVLNQNSLLYRIASDERFVKIAQAYFGNQGCSLFYADYWYTVPTDGDRIASQAWHRDTEDSRLLKVFVYLNDIGEDNGCFEFLKKTSNGLENGNLKPHFKISQSVRATQATDEFILRNDQLLFKGVGKKYDVIFCDTTGFHRGGFVKEGNRKLVNFIYVSNNCPHIYYSIRDRSNKVEKFTF